MSWNPALPADTSLMRLSAGYIRGNETAVQNVLGSNLTGNTVYLPNSALIWMAVNSAPTGWTMVMSTGDCLLAIQASSPNTSVYNAAGGTSIVGSWNGPGYTLLTTDLPQNALFTFSGVQFTARAFAATPNPGNPHQHNYATGAGADRPQATVGILVTKNS